MASPTEETNLKARLAETPEDNEEYATILSDLAELHLSKGEVEEANRLYEKLYSQRKDAINQISSADAEAAAGSAADSDESDDWDKQSWEAPVLRTAASFDKERNQDSQQQQQQQRRQADYKSSAKGRHRTTVVRKDDHNFDTLGVRELPHVVELYDLTRQVKTTQIEEFLVEYAWGGVGPTVKWVDDNHALAVFSCREAAEALLDSNQKTFKVRAYSKACEQAHLLPSEELTPPSAVRPKTTTAVARRLIGSALGNTAVLDREAERELAQLRREKKQGKKEREEQLAAAWEEG